MVAIQVEAEEPPAEASTAAHSVHLEVGAHEEADRYDSGYDSTVTSGGLGKRRTYTEATTQLPRVLKGKGPAAG